MDQLLAKVLHPTVTGRNPEERTSAPRVRKVGKSRRRMLAMLMMPPLVTVLSLAGTGAVEASSLHGANGPAAPSGSGTVNAAKGQVPRPSGKDTPHGLHPAVRGKGRTTGRATAYGGDTYSNNYMYNQGNGAVQTDPRVYLIYWGDWSTDTYGVMNRLYNFYRGIGGSAWGKVMTQYQQNCTPRTWTCTGPYAGNPAAPFKGWYKDTTRPVPAMPTQAQINAEAVYWAQNWFHDTSYNAQYVVALPRGHGDTAFNAGTDCAWHDYAYIPGTTSWVTATALPYQPDNRSCYMGTVNGSAGALDGVTIVAGHEYAESITDPGLNGWYDAVTKNGGLWENGDKCAGYQKNMTFSTGTFPVTATWSNYYRYYHGQGCVYWS
jgi:serine protease